MLLTGGRNDRGIRNQVVHVGGAHGSEKTNVAELYRGGTQGEDVRAPVCGEASEINGNIDPELSGKRRDLQIGTVADVEEAIEGLLQALAHRIGRMEDRKRKP